MTAEKTTREMLEKRIAQLEQDVAYYRLVADNATDMISRHDPDGVFTYASPAAIALTGYTHSELVGRNAYDFFHPDDLDGIRKSHRAIVEKPITNSVPYRFKHKKGHYVWVEARSKVLRNAGTGEVAEIIATTRDIGEQKRSEAQLKKSEERYKFLVENMGDIVWTLDNELKVTYVSPSIENILGFKVEERRHLSLSKKITPKSYERLMERIRIGLQETQKKDDPERISAMELEYYHRNGSIVILENHAKTLRDENGAITGMYGVSRDITARRRAEAHQRFQAQMLKEIHDSVIATDIQGIITHWNKGSERLFYYTEPECLGKHVSMLYPIEFRNRLQKEIIPYLFTRGNHEYNTILLRKGGSHFDAMISLSLLHDADGTVIGMVAYSQDITERVKAEDALRESEVRFRVLFEQANVPIFVHDLLGRFHMVNTKACRKLGYTNDELLNLKVGHVDPDFAAREDERRFWKNLPVTFEGRHRKKDGSTFPVEVRLSQIRFRDQDLVLAMTADITERVRAKQALADSEQRLSDIIEFLPDPTLVIDIRGRVIAWNQAIEKMSGIAKGQILGKGNYAHAIPFFGEPRPVLIDLVLKPEKQWEQTYLTFTRKDGLLAGCIFIPPKNGQGGRYIEGTAAKLFDAQGNVVGAIETLRDTTDRRKIEEDLKRSNEELEQFAYAASHDLQEPLRAIVGFLQLLESRYGDRIDIKGKHYIERCVLAGHRMQTLIRELLTLSRVTTRGENFVPTDLHQLVARLVDQLHMDGQKQKAAITCEYLPALHVDGNQIHSLFQNLILNALKYNQSTNPKVVISCRKRPQDYLFAIADNGIGICEKFHQRIFTVFQRLHTDQEYPGTGLGLALCKKIVERHGGAIWVQSEPGQGSTFYFTLPGRR